MQKLSKEHIRDRQQQHLLVGNYYSILLIDCNLEYLSDKPLPIEQAQHEDALHSRNTCFFLCSWSLSNTSGCAGIDQSKNDDVLRRRCRRRSWSSCLQAYDDVLCWRCRRRSWPCSFWSGLHLLESSVCRETKDWLVPSKLKPDASALEEWVETREGICQKEIEDWRKFCALCVGLHLANANAIRSLDWIKIDYAASCRA